MAGFLSSLRRDKRRFGPRGMNPLPPAHAVANAAAEPAEHDQLTLSAAARRLPELIVDGIPISVPALSRWASRGRLSTAKQRVRLRTWRIGGRPVTSRAAVIDFLDALNDGDAPAHRKATDTADAELAALGV